MKVRLIIGVLALVAVGIAEFALVSYGLYGYTLFVFLPVILGGLPAFVRQPDRGATAAGHGALAVIAGSVFLLALGWEGMICIAMAAPLTIPLGAIGGWLVYWAQTARLRKPGVALLILMPPFAATWDAKTKPEIFQVTTAIEVAATPEQVWKHVVTFSDIPEPTDWLFRTGLAYPKRARIVGTGAAATRYCEFSTGAFVEPIEVWDEPRLLRFAVTENPAPMHEWTLSGSVTPNHLHGYMVSKRGQFRLVPLSDGRTLLEGTTWYQHGLWPAAYWRWWSDAIIHRIHLRVLGHIQTLGAGDQSRSSK